MVYPASFHRLVLLGTLYGDRFNTSLSIVPTGTGDFGASGPVTTGDLTAMAAVLSPWFSGNLPDSSSNCISSAKLTGFKLNRINTAGKYQDPETMEYTWGAPISGGGSSAQLAPQLAHVATLRTAIPRGRASKGRMYLPPTLALATLGTDGRTTIANALAQANGVKALINSINTLYGAEGRVGVASDVGAGAFQYVTEVSVGRVADTIRSRRSSLIEDYQTVAVAP